MTRLLIVDDDDEDIFLIKKDIQKAKLDFEIDHALEADEGMELLRKNNYDIVLVDTILAKTDGFSLCRRIKSDVSITTKVILMTGKIDAVDPIKITDSKCDGYCVKTTSSPSVLIAIDEVMAEK